MQEITTYEEAQRIEFDQNAPTIDKILEERINMIQKTIHDLYLRNSNLWRTICMEKGNTKETC